MTDSQISLFPPLVASSSLGSSILPILLTPPADFLRKTERWLHIGVTPTLRRGVERSKVWKHGYECRNEEKPGLRGWRCDHCVKDHLVVLYCIRVEYADKLSTSFGEQAPCCFRQGVRPEGDQFDPCISGSTTTFGTDSADSPITWPLGPENLFAGITQQAIDVLSIPAVSAELERAFSQAKHMVTPMRSRMTDETLEMHELLRHLVGEQQFATSHISSNVSMRLHQLQYGLEDGEEEQHSSASRPR